MIVWFGVRPGLRMLLAPPVVAAASEPSALAVPEPGQNLLLEREPPRDEFLEALLARRDNGPERKLLRLVEFDEGQAATILKQWIRQGANG